MDLGIQGKRALVCAASRGLARATAFALAREGVELFLCSRDEDTLAQTAREIEAETGRDVSYKACDLSDRQEREALVDSVKSVFSSLDILIHNAGGPKPSTAEATSLEDWERGFHQNFLSVVHLNQAFLPGMKANGWGRILIITSLSPMEPVPNLAVSNGVRAAITAMAKTLSNEVAPQGVTVNCVAPGVIHTDRTEDLIQAQIAKKGGSREEYMSHYLQSIPAGRLGKPEEFAAVMTFLCSQQASYITGSTISVDGGKRRSTY
jgi:3-oxoacyl-[acyl-carrier protein] reductase